MGMSGPSGSRGRRGKMSEINVTPLVDVMLVLLIIFMVAAPMMQQGIEVDLPKTSPSGVSTNEDPFTLVVKQNRSVFAGTAQIPLDQLKEKLTAIFETRQNKQIYIQADRRVDYGIVAEVMAEVRGAGITNIGLITEPK
jgi:biopolymer transport protein TolR